MYGLNVVVPLVGEHSLPKLVYYLLFNQMVYGVTQISKVYIENPEYSKLT